MWATRHVQFGHGRILRFLDHEDPSLRLDHNPAPSRLSCLPANRARKRHLYLASLRLKKLMRSTQRPTKERSCVLIVYTRLWSISRIASCCADSSQWQHGNTMTMIGGFKTSSTM